MRDASVQHSHAPRRGPGRVPRAAVLCNHLSAEFNRPPGEQTRKKAGLSIFPTSTRSRSSRASRKPFTTRYQPLESNHASPAAHDARRTCDRAKRSDMRKTARHFEPSTQQTISPAPPEADVAPRMPLIRLKPHKARVVIEDGAEMILVLKVSLNRGETVELASGGKMEALNGMLRIRERGGLLTRADGRIAGKLTYVPETASGGSRAPAEFQIDVPLGPREFRVLLDLGRAGRLPHKIFMQAGDRTASRSRAASPIARRAGARPSSGTTSRIGACRSSTSRSSCPSRRRQRGRPLRAARAAARLRRVRRRTLRPRHATAGSGATTTIARRSRLASDVRLVLAGRGARRRADRLPERDAPPAHRAADRRGPHRGDHRRRQRPALPQVARPRGARRAAAARLAMRARPRTCPLYPRAFTRWGGAREPTGLPGTHRRRDGRRGGHRPRHRGAARARAARRWRCGTATQSALGGGEGRARLRRTPRRWTSRTSPPWTVRPRRPTPRSAASTSWSARPASPVRTRPTWEYPRRGLEARLRRQRARALLLQPRGRAR